VEEKDPARGREYGGDERDGPAGKTRDEDGEYRHARDGQEGGEQSKLRQAAARMGYGPGEHEVERRSTALAEHRVEELRQRAVPDEECERLVLMRRPCSQPKEQEGAYGSGAAGDACDERPRRDVVSPGHHFGAGKAIASAAAASLILMPFYEYRCPKGHVFERFQRMTDPPPEACESCGEGPVSTVLFPVAVHFKGSGFYSTDYGRGSHKRDGAKDDSGSDSSTDSGGTSEPAAKPEKKAAEA